MKSRRFKPYPNRNSQNVDRLISLNLDLIINFFNIAALSVYVGIDLVLMKFF
jgi:hypothetical protein